MFSKAMIVALAASNQYDATNNDLAEQCIRTMQVVDRYVPNRKFNCIASNRQLDLGFKIT